MTLFFHSDRAHHLNDGFASERERRSALIVELKLQIQDKELLILLLNLLWCIMGFRKKSVFQQTWNNILGHKFLKDIFSSFSADLRKSKSEWHVKRGKSVFSRIAQKDQFFTTKTCAKTDRVEKGNLRKTNLKNWFHLLFEQSQVFPSKTFFT